MFDFHVGESVVVSINGLFLAIVIVHLCHCAEKLFFLVIFNHTDPSSYQLFL